MPENNRMTFHISMANALVKEVLGGAGFRVRLARVVIAMLVTSIVVIGIMELVS